MNQCKDCAVQQATHLPAEAVQSEPVYTLRVSGVFHDHTPTGAAFNLADGVHKLYTHPAQQELKAPTLDDAWKARLLDGAPLERDKYGCGYHPALPTFDEGVNGARFFAVFGIELMARMAECEMDDEAYEAMTINGFTEDGPNYNAWTPAKPAGDGWCLVAVFDTEDGPACWWVRAAQAKQGEQANG